MSRIEDICRELNNWFDVKRAIGDFEITENGLTSFYDDLYDDQYYRIVGSALNDGVYKKGEISIHRSLAGPDSNIAHY